MHPNHCYNQSVSEHSMCRKMFDLRVPSRLRRKYNLAISQQKATLQVIKATCRDKGTYKWSGYLVSLGNNNPAKDYDVCMHVYVCGVGNGC